MPGKPRYTAQDVIDALRKTKGMAYLAAKELGCSHTTVYNYIARHPTVKAEFDYQRGELLDAAELKLREAVLAGEQWAIQFALRLLGKDRGYSEHTDVTSGGKPIKAYTVLAVSPDVWPGEKEEGDAADHSD